MRGMRVDKLREEEQKRREEGRIERDESRWRMEGGEGAATVE